MKLIHKKLVNFVNFVFCVFKVLQCMFHKLGLLECVVLWMASMRIIFEIFNSKASQTGLSVS